jgi:hypothetical protein
MATQLIDSGRIQLQGGGNVPMQRVTPQAVEPIGARVQAQGSSQIADALDRMSAQLFQDSFRLREQEGLQFAAQNPLTPEQFEAAKNGNLSTLDLGGNPVSVFQQAVRKARALQLSQRFEMEGNAELVNLLKMVELGEANSEQVLTKINTMTDGLGRTLSKIDPEAVYKFRASMATTGNAVYEKALNAEIKRAQEQALIRVDANFRNRREILQAVAEDKPETFDLHAQVFLSDITRQAQTLSNPTLQAQFSQQAIQAIKEAKVNIIVKQLNTPENAASNPLDVTGRIRRGELGRHSPLLKSLLTGPQRDEAAVRNIEKEFMSYATDYIRLRDENEKKDKRDREIKANTLMTEYFQPGTNNKRKVDIANEVAGLRVLSIEQLEKFLDPKSKDGDPYVMADIENRIVNGDIASYQDLRGIAMRAGMSGKQFSQLSNRLFSGVTKAEADALRYIRRAAGVPDVQSLFATDANKAQIAKEERVKGIFKDKVNEFRTKNPGQTIPYEQLARDADAAYTQADGKDAVKNAARASLKRDVDELVKKKKVTDGFTIDESTNVDDLVQKKIISEKDAPRIKRQIDVLRGVSQ